MLAGKGWLAVDKPAGLTVHNEAGRDLCSYAAAFIQKVPAPRKQIDMDSKFGVHPVHRLDKETSGVILLCVDREMLRFFSSQFESSRIKKQYIAMVHGRLEVPEGSDPWGKWDRPLSESRRRTQISGRA